MRIAKPLLIVTTTLGLAIGLYEAAELAGGLVFLLAAMIVGFGAAMAALVVTIRRERAGSGGPRATRSDRDT